MLFHFLYLVAQAGSMCLEPVCAPSAVCHERNVERVGVLHLLKDDALHLLFFFRKDAEVEFVVHLKYHFRAYTFRLKALEYFNHGYFDNVGSTSLDGSVDGIPFGIAPYHPVS